MFGSSYLLKIKSDQFIFLLIVLKKLLCKNKIILIIFFMNLLQDTIDN